MVQWLCWVYCLTFNAVVLFSALKIWLNWCQQEFLLLVWYKTLLLLLREGCGSAWRDPDPTFIIDAERIFISFSRICYRYLRCLKRHVAICTVQRGMSLFALFKEACRSLRCSKRHVAICAVQRGMSLFALTLLTLLRGSVRIKWPDKKHVLIV